MITSAFITTWFYWCFFLLLTSDYPTYFLNHSPLDHLSLSPYHKITSTASGKYKSPLVQALAQICVALQEVQARSRLVQAAHGSNPRLAWDAGPTACGGHRGLEVGGPNGSDMVRCTSPDSSGICVAQLGYATGLRHWQIRIIRLSDGGEKASQPCGVRIGIAPRAASAMVGSRLGSDSGPNGGFGWADGILYGAGRQVSFGHGCLREGDTVLVQLDLKHGTVRYFRNTAEVCRSIPLLPPHPQLGAPPPLPASLPPPRPPPPSRPPLSP